MRTDDDSWIATSEVTLVPEPGDELNRALEIRVVSVSGDLLSGRLVGHEAEPQLMWRRRLLPLVYSSPYYRGKPEKQPYYFAQAVLRQANINVEPSFLEYAIHEALVPVLGSPPRDWQTIGQMISSGGISAGGVIALGMGAKPSVAFLFSVAGMTVFVNVIVPASRALGRGLEHRIDQLLGTPPRKASKDDTDAKAPS